jgi:hypothetical protein
MAAAFFNDLGNKIGSIFGTGDSLPWTDAEMISVSSLFCFVLFCFFLFSFFSFCFVVQFAGSFFSLFLVFWFSLYGVFDLLWHS